jgi:hypothetical protein
MTMTDQLTVPGVAVTPEPSSPRRKLDNLQMVDEEIDIASKVARYHLKTGGSEPSNMNVT